MAPLLQLERRICLQIVAANIRFYLEDRREVAAHEFMRYTSLGIEHRPRTPLELIRSWLGRSRHLWMWDFKSLSVELSSAGFVEIRKCAFGDSPDAMFTQIEVPARYEYDALAVECRKP
jgi:hypothetical protein